MRPAGDRAGRDPAARPVCRADPGPAGRPLPAADRGETGRAAPAPDAARRGRVEFRPVFRVGAPAVGTLLGVRRRIRPGRRGERVRRGRAGRRGRAHLRCPAGRSVGAGAGKRRGRPGPVPAALSWLNWNLSVGWWAAGDLGNAETCATEALRLKRALGDQLGIPFCLELLAWAAASDGEPERAAALFGAVEHLWQRIGTPLVAGEPLVAWSKQAKARVLDELDGRAHERARKQGARMRQDEIIAYALREKAAAAG